MRLPFDLSAVVHRRPALTGALLLFVTVAALVAAARLRPAADLESLLPEGSPAADAYREYLAQFGGFEKVFVVIRAAPEAAIGSDLDAELEDQKLLEAAWALEEELADRPGIKSVRSGLESADQEFFLRHVAPRAVFLLPTETWQQTFAARLAPAEIERRALWLRAQAMLPGREALMPVWQADPLGLLEEVTLSAGGDSLPLEPWTSSFFSQHVEGGVPSASLVVVTPSSSELDPDSGRRLAADLDAAFEHVRQKTDGDIQMLAVGGPLYAAQDEQLIRRDLTATLATSAAGCALVLALAFGGVTLPVLTLLSVLVGLIWLAATLALGFGSVSALSLGFAAVLVGLGVDYGIHLATRYRECSLQDLSDHSAGGSARNNSALAAWRATLAATWRPITVSAATTAAAFTVLLAAHLQPLRELGAVVGLGMLFLWVASLLVGGFLLVTFGRRAAQKPPGRLWRGLGHFVDGSVGMAQRRPASVLTLAVVASLLAVPGVARLRLDADLRALRPQPSPSAVAEQLLAESFGVGSDTASVLISDNSLGSALARARAVASLLRRELPASTALTSPAELVAIGEDVDRRLEVLAELPIAAAVDRLETALRDANLDPGAFAIGLDALRSLARGEDPGLPAKDLWPDWLTDSIREPDYSVADAGWVAIHLRLAEGVWPQGPPAQLIAAIEALAPGALVATSGAVAVELASLARRDLRRLAGLSLGVIALVVLVGLGGRLAPAFLATVPVLLGTLWTLGALGFFAGRLDLISLSLIPILLGIGIDDGLHAVADIGSGSLPGGSLGTSVLAAGRAMSLTTLTTAVGFGSLLLSSLPGLRRGGLALAGGVVLCLLATLFVLPAIESLTAKSRRATSR